MPTIITHAVAGAAIALALAPCSWRSEITWIAAACAMLPDADVLGFGFGISYEDLWGHRGITHSLFFSALTALVVTAIFRNKAPAQDLVQIFACIFGATASHGFLDAFTNGGLGVAFFAPFDPSRYFFPWRPILVSPIGLTAFLSERGASVLISEITWVWPPSIALFLAARFGRCRG
jgi:inner membrane protein